MKTCPTCGKSYADDLNFCLEDGANLRSGATADYTDHPTEILHAQTNERESASIATRVISEQDTIISAPKPFQSPAAVPSRNTGRAFTIGLAAAGLLVFVGFGAAGIFYTFRGSNDAALLEPMSVNRSVNNSADNPMSANATGVSNTNIVPQNSAIANKLSTQTSDPMENDRNSSTNTSSGQPNATPRPAPKTISGGVLNGKAVSLPAPAYPAAARAVHAGGIVSVQVLVGENGSVLTASAVSGHPLLQGSAVQAARSARFSPTLVGGMPVKVSGVITYNFVP